MVKYFFNEILSFWNCASKNSKEGSVFFKFGRNFDAQILKIHKMHRKIRIEQMPLSFWKYLRNENSDLHEILCCGQFLSCELKFQISWRSMNKCARTSCKHARARFITTACMLCVFTFYLDFPTNLSSDGAFSPEH